MHLKEVTHSNGSYERKSRGRKLADEMGRGKKFPWYTHRLMHRKRVTCELHDSYFRLMTIKHSQSRRKSSASWVPVELKIGRSYRRDVAGKATSGWRGLWALMSWGPEKMLIRCRKESHHPAEWPLDLRFSSPKERERHNVDGHKSGGQNIAVSVRSPAPSHTQTFVQPFCTLTNKVRGIYFSKEVCVRLYLLCSYDAVDEHITIWYQVFLSQYKYFVHDPLCYGLHSRTTALQCWLWHMGLRRFVGIIWFLVWFRKLWVFGFRYLTPLVFLSTPI